MQQLNADMLALKMLSVTLNKTQLAMLIDFVCSSQDVSREQYIETLNKFATEIRSN